MRLIYLALIVFGLVLALGIAGVARSGDPAPQQFAAKAAMILPTAAPQAMSPIRDVPLQFCGQCSSDSDCGSNHKCCGPSNCLECFRVDTCP